MPPRAILVITGASGSGKTALVEALETVPLPGVTFHHFDSLGVPSREEMIAGFGSPDAWQVARTHEWITRLTSQAGQPTLAVLEGQVRPAVVMEAYRTNQVRHGRVLLLDCSPEVRTYRITALRGQPQLATADMLAWAAYLRGQADALHIPTLDTTALSLADAGLQLRAHILELAAGVRARASTPQTL